MNAVLKPRESLLDSAMADVVRYVVDDRDFAKSSNASSAPHKSEQPWWLEAQDLNAARDKRKWSRLPLLIAVGLVHLLALYAIVHWSPKLTHFIDAPMQVTMMSDTVARPERLPQMIQPRLTAVDVAVETPVITIAEADTNAITVAPPTTKAVASVTTSGHMPKLVSSVEYIRAPVPHYPAAARALHQSGVVMLRALIDVTGNAREVTIHRSSGSRLLDDAGREAVMAALFKPYMENGHAQEVFVLVPIEFGAAVSAR